MTRKIRILIAEDDPAITRILQRNLVAQKYEVFTTANGNAALSLAEQKSPELILLDLGLPGMNGLDVCKNLRTRSQLPAIIVISVRSKEQEKVQALDLGADDYIAKPFGIDEVMARVRVALRHSAYLTPTTSSASFEIGPLSVDTARHHVQLNAQDIKLTPTEYKLLVFFLYNQDKILTQQMLLRHIWGNEEAAQASYLHVYIAHLRRKLEPDTTSPRFFHTISGVGYRFQSTLETTIT
ncbi:response regulator transcription factor [Dictyobacter formicarum]|uniref:DNA-binding response regulator n=1 Tax=Dictyobacter formicarum TaxID=2778368 RepID=A0ABQ3VQW6_9CHLR|nr:response regulator transcription factor [Dictyobacter formicarum]GHO88662.1 DNA-binding response regulator [Dictyobacter formicarum]